MGLDRPRDLLLGEGGVQDHEAPGLGPGEGQVPLPHPAEELQAESFQAVRAAHPAEGGLRGQVQEEGEPGLKPPGRLPGHLPQPGEGEAPAIALVGRLESR